MTATPISAPIAIRRGPGNWGHSLTAMLRWHLTSMRLFLPLLVIVQMLIAAGLSVGMSLFFDQLTPESAIYLATGSAIINLIVVGLVVAPQLIAGEKDEGTYDFSWSLPVPRSASVTAWLGLNALVGIPSMVIALAIGAWRLDVSYTVSWSVVPAVLLVLVCGTMLGSAVAHAIDKTAITQLLSQVFAFGILGFTPITYPPSHLPDWLASIHEVLPFYHMGVIVRGGLTVGMVTDVWVSYSVVLGWTLLAVVVTALVLGRRG